MTDGTKKSFEYELGDMATITLSGESGQVRGRTEYFDAEYPHNYLLRYKAADGRVAEGWYTASFLNKASAAA